ncbi:MAG: ATPase, T2SS/T4P/T4SS family [Bdellovibrionales bacterium]
MINSLLKDPSVTEIILQNSDDLVIEKNGELIGSKWDPSDYKAELINEIIQALPKAPTYEHPIASGVWREFRVQIINAPIVNKQPIIQLRRISKDGDFRQLDPDQWSTSLEVIETLKEKFSIKRENFLIVGPTGCGKTTLLKALLSNYCQNERVLCIEDTPELPLVNEFSCNLKTYTSSTEEIKDVSLNDLVKASLRMRPDRIIMGEMRGEEASSFLLMLSTGHKGSGATLHAHTSQDALYRLEMLIQMGSSWSLETVRRLIRTSLDCIIVLDKDPTTGARYIKEVSEIAGLEESGFLVHHLHNTNSEDLGY